MTSSSQARIRPNALDGGSTRIEKAGRAVKTVQPPEAPAFLISHTECCWLGEGTIDVVEHII